MEVNSLPKTVTRQRRGCDFNPGPSVPESSTLTTRLPSHPQQCIIPVPSCEGVLEAPGLCSGYAHTLHKSERGRTKLSCGMLGLSMASVIQLSAIRTSTA